MIEESAVEYLIDEILHLMRKPYQFKLLMQAYIKAKEIEKRQIIAAFDMACMDADRVGEEYYNETYLNENNDSTIKN